MKKKKDLIFITDEYPYKNGESFIETEIKYLAKQFNQIYIISKNINIKNEKITRKLPSNCKSYIVKRNYIKLFKLFDFYYLKDFLCNIKFFKNLRIGWFMFNSKLVEDKVKEVIKQNNLKKEEIVVYSYWFYHGAYATGILKRKSIINKVISRAHGYDLFFERGYQPLKKEILKNIDEVSSVSKEGMKYLKKKYNKNNIGYSYLGTINKNEFKTKEKSKLLVSCSNLIPLKRVELIVEALEKLDKKYKDLQWLHFGDGEEREELEKLAKEKLKSIKHEFKGRISNQEVLKYYKENNILCFLHMSSTEGLPVSMMEVQSFGIPIIAIDVGGVGEIVNDKTGILLKDNVTVDEIALNIEKFINMPEEEYKSYQVNSYNNWKESFNAEKNYREFIEKYLLR